MHSGARLRATEKARLKEINQQLASLYTAFGQNVLADEEGYVLFLDDADMQGVPAWLKASLGQMAEEKGQPGRFAIANSRSSMDPFLTYSPRRDLREKVWGTYYKRGGNGDEHDNHDLIADILRLRHERAVCLGYPNHAAWMPEDTMAKTPEQAMDLLMAVWSPAVARAREEVAEMQAIADREQAQIEIEPWDYRYYAEKLRAAKYDLDMNAVKPYLQLEKLREAMMWASDQLFGLRYREAPEVPVFHPDVRVWEVLDAQDRPIGLWYFDPYARAGKHSGAWMDAYRAQHRLGGTETTTLVSNNSNFVKGAPGEPVLISWDDATTLFHEFGHALHGLNSKVTYPKLSGTSVSRDYVEFPSQLNEHWLTTPEIMERFLVHYETGEPIPKALVDKIEKASTFRQGFDTVEYLACAIVDMRMHTTDPSQIDPRTVERETLAAIGMPKEIVMRHRTPHFAHVFTGDGYSAGYYSYLWADTLVADAAEAFEGAGSYFDPVVAKRLHDAVLSVGNTVEPEEGFRQFRGRDVDTAALMRKRGFPQSGDRPPE